MFGSSPAKAKKTLVMLLDGTWQDGATLSTRSQATNIWKLARAIKSHTKDGSNVVISYEAGVGAADWVPGERVADGIEAILQGATGMGLSTKVKEAYIWLARNWCEGDEIHIYGFSRGAYTARTVAALINAIGFLDTEGLENFHAIFKAYLQLSSPSSVVKEQATRYLAYWRQNARPDWEKQQFIVKVLGVFDTVGAQGLPKGLALPLRKTRQYFGFNDSYLGKRIENGFHALALNENRLDFTPAPWSFKPVEGQHIKQVAFIGSHADVGGGYAEADLSDIAMTWMASEVVKVSNLEFDFDLMRSFMAPVAPYGKLPPHNPITDGDVISVIAKDMVRKPLPGCLIHESVLSADYHLWPADIHEAIEDAARTLHSSSAAECRIARLNKEEQVLRDQWRVVHNPTKSQVAAKKLYSVVKAIAHNSFYIFRTTPGAVEPSLLRAPAALFRATTGLFLS